MLETYEKSKAVFSMYFGGEKDIDLKTLITTLEGTAELINNVANAQDEDAIVKLNVVATREGSFVVELAATATIVRTLITVENINFVKSCIDSVCSLISIKKHLKGERPKKQESSNEGIVIGNIEGQNITVDVNIYKLYTDENDETISNIFTNYDRDYLKIVDSEGQGVQVDKVDYGSMRKEISLADTNNEQIINNIIKTNLTIKRPDLIGASKWELIYSSNGNQKTIKATIEDSQFQQDIHSGKISISAKTSISVELETIVYINEIGETVKTQYTVKKVLKVYQNNDVQMSLDE